MSIESMYQDVILDHYHHPHHQGLREPYDAEAHHINPTCGDEITLRVALKGDTIADVSYKAEGCSISQASASVLADLLIGKTVPVAFAGVSKYPARIKCALLSWMAWKDATAQAVEGANHD
jgi:nitrogen fixation NifU-like protein